MVKVRVALQNQGDISRHRRGDVDISAMSRLQTKQGHVNVTRRLFDVAVIPKLGCVNLNVDLHFSSQGAVE